MKKTTISIFAGLFVLAAAMILGLGMKEARADLLDPYYYSTDGSDCYSLWDDNYYTTEFFEPGTEVTISSETAIDSLYIMWEDEPGEWTLRINGNNYTFGQNNFLHEFVQIPEAEKGATEVTFVVGDHNLNFASVYVFSEGELPDYVQQWEPPYEEADMLFLSTHADDEALFFGTTIATYTDKEDVRVQVAYFTDQDQNEPYRNHEILNGLWVMGVTHYPELGRFYDYYSETYEEAESQFNYDESLDFVVEIIRKYKPQVLIGQDIINGEYGHGAHMWTAMLITKAIESAADSGQYQASASAYGTWDVPKTYLHLYNEGAIELDARVPLESFGGKTALEIAKEAYLEHDSQQWCWFYVSDGYDDEGNPDGYEYSCTKFGLYRSLVGADTGNDMLENVTTYAEQEAELRAAAEAEAAARLAEEESIAAAEAEAEAAAAKAAEAKVTGRKILIIALVAAALIVLVIMIIVFISARKAAKEAERKRLQRLKRQQAARRASAQLLQQRAKSRAKMGDADDDPFGSTTSITIQRRNAEMETAKTKLGKK